MRRELLEKLGHDVEVPQPLPTSPLPAPIPAPVQQHLADQESMVSPTATSASTTSDAQKINSKIIIADADQTADSGGIVVLQKINSVPAPAMVQAPREHSPVAAGESKKCSGLQIIRKSMFKFVIKLGLAGDNGAGHPMACQ
jgi:hypothetical protein